MWAVHNEGALPDPRRRRVVRAGSRGPARLARAGARDRVEHEEHEEHENENESADRIGTNRSGPAPGLLADGADDEVDDRGVEDGDREFEEVLAEAEREEDARRERVPGAEHEGGRRRTRRRRRSRCRWPDCWRSTRRCAATACRGRCGRGSRGRRPRPSSGSRRTRAGSRRRRWPRGRARCRRRPRSRGRSRARRGWTRRARARGSSRGRRR